jgi:hypothetical protein
MLGRITGVNNSIKNRIEQGNLTNINSQGFASPVTVITNQLGININLVINAGIRK